MSKLSDLEQRTEQAYQRFLEQRTEQAYQRFANLEEWGNAREVASFALKMNPDDHWWLTSLSLCYYEQFKYKQSLKIIEKAWNLGYKNCSLLIWNYAGSLGALGRHEEAIKMYRRITSKTPEHINDNECGEGLRHSKSLIADAHFQIAMNYHWMGKSKLAKRYVGTFLGLKKKWRCGSVYTPAEIKKYREKIDA